MTRVLESLLEFCYPGSCAACGAGCPGQQPLCISCTAQLAQAQERGACQRCGAPLVLEGAPCPYCKGRGLPPLRGVARLAAFADPLKGAIHHMKYRRDWPLAEQLADRLWATPVARRVLGGADVLVPVPLHRLRQIARGYNQAEVIARRLARHSGLKMARALLRVRPTASQTNMPSHSRREENLRGAFALRLERAVAGKRVVLVDDVMTSGATLRAAARALMAAKPRSVDVVVLAVADPKARDFQAV